MDYVPRGAETQFLVTAVLRGWPFGRPISSRRRGDNRPYQADAQLYASPDMDRQLYIVTPLKVSHNILTVKKNSSFILPAEHR